MTAIKDTRRDEVLKFADWQVGLVADWLGNSVTHGRIVRPIAERVDSPFASDTIQIEFDGLGVWLVPVDKISLPGEQLRWLESFVSIRGDNRWELSTIAFVGTCNANK